MNLMHFGSQTSRSQHENGLLCDIDYSYTSVRDGDRMRQLIIYCFGHIVDLVVLLVYYSGCVDRSGSLSSSAFNQLRLVMLNIVLTILY